MKLFLLFLLILGILYLNRTYAYFYNFQGDHFIGNPNYSSTHLLAGKETGSVKKLTVLGDSLMAGTGSSKEENSMAYLIANNLSKEAGIQLNNLASPGVGVKDVLNRQVPEAIKMQPDYIVLMIGTNDVHNQMREEEFKKKFMEIVNRLSEETNAKITVINIPSIGSDKILIAPWNNFLDLKTQHFNKIIEDCVSGRENAKLVDLFSKFRNDFRHSSDLYSYDEFHPSDKGYALWADYIYSNLNK